MEKNNIYKKIEKKFNKFIKEIKIEDIDLDNKIGNLIEGEIENNKLITDNYDIIINHKKEIFNYIKNNINNYRNDIISETIILKDKYNCTFDYDLTAGLYNMDNFYISAIKEILK